MNDLSQKDRDRLRDLELTLWGRTGQNGVVGNLKDFRREFHAYVEEEEKQRREEAQESKADRRQRVLMTLGLVSAIVSPIIGWALLSVSS
jgi:hypothetical protein